MWEEIFSHPAIQKRVLLRTLLLRMPLFEDVLEEATNPRVYNDEDRAVINLAIEEAFQRMDSEHAAYLSRERPDIDSMGVREFFNWFYSSEHNVGYIFSLNQDCLKERLFGFRMDRFGISSPIFPGFPGIPFSLPGVRHSMVSMPEICDVEISDASLAGNLNYIKLHGSFLWLPADRSAGMVLGGAKTIAIGRSALLTRYHKIFERVLYAGDVRLLIIGYGFQDAHINRIIATAVQSFGARIFLWDKRDPLELLEKVKIDRPAPTIDLRPCLCGAASRPLAEVFPAGGHPTAEYVRIRASFLQ
jgi:hypothetical protein